MRTHVVSRIGSAMLVACATVVGGCGFDLGILNPAFVNTVIGGSVPVTPGPGAPFVLTRCVNDTGQPVEFIVTIQRSVLVIDADGNYQVDEQGEFVTRPERETVRLTTAAAGRARELGVLFRCAESPITHVGLGENLLPTDAAIYVGGQGVGGAAGFGVAAGGLNPLQFDAGNFNCGDTVIFRAFQSVGVAGGVGLRSFLLPGSEQPSIFTGPDTFTNLERIIESQVREDEP